MATLEELQRSTAQVMTGQSGNQHFIEKLQEARNNRKSILKFDMGQNPNYNLWNEVKNAVSRCSPSILTEHLLFTKINSKKS